MQNHFRIYIKLIFFCSGEQAHKISNKVADFSKAHRQIQASMH